MPEEGNINSLGNFSDLEDDILIKQDGFFKIFSHGNLSDFDTSIKSEKKSTEVLDTGLEEKILPPPPPAIFENKKAEFYFDINDRDEIVKHEKNLEKIKAVKKQYSLKKITDKIIEANAINLVQQLESKFNSLIFSFLKHTRTKFDLEEVFNNRIINSGLGFDKDKTNKILNILSEIRGKIEESGGDILNDINAKSLSELSKKDSDLKTTEHLSNLDPRQSIQIKPVNSDIPFVNRTVDAPSSPYKTKLSDVKQKPRVVSPVEELGEINITIFRRLSSNPLEAAQRIMDNINSFGHESILKKAMAVKNWRKSEVYRIYLALGRESIDKNLPINKIIEQKIVAKEKTLTMEEFKAISDINKKVKF